MTAAVLFQIFNLALGAIPVAADTIMKIRQIFATDPTIPAEFKSLIAGTIQTNLDGQAAIDAWQAAHPLDGSGLGSPTVNKTFTPRVLSNVDQILLGSLGSPYDNSIPVSSK